MKEKEKRTKKEKKKEKKNKKKAKKLIFESLYFENTWCNLLEIWNVMVEGISTANLSGFEQATRNYVA